MASTDTTFTVNADGDTITITPSATATVDTTVKVAVSKAGMSKITLAASVMVTVDRTVPTIEFPANAPTTGTVGMPVVLPFTISNGTGVAGTIPVTEIDVVQTTMATPPVIKSLPISPSRPIMRCWYGLDNIYA